MKISFVVGVALVVAAMVWYEWPKIGQEQKGERAAFVVMTALGSIFVLMLIFYPDVPGPIHLIDMIFKPLGKLLER